MDAAHRAHALDRRAGRGRTDRHPARTSGAAAGARAVGAGARAVGAGAHAVGAGARALATSATYTSLPRRAGDGRRVFSYGYLGARYVDENAALRQRETGA